MVKKKTALAKTRKVTKVTKKVKTPKMVVKVIPKANMVMADNSNLAALSLDYVVRTWNKQNPSDIIGRYVVRMAQSQLGQNVAREKLLEFIGENR